MAAAYRAGASNGTTTTTSGAPAITLPTSGTGGTVAAGDVAVYTVIYGASETTFTPPAGLNQKVAPTLNTVLNLGIAVYTQTLAAGDLGSTKTWSLSSSTEWLVFVNIFSGADESSFAFSAATFGNSSSSTFADPAVTVPAGGFILGAWAGFINSSTTFTVTKPASYTAGNAQATSNASNNRAAATAYLSGSGSLGGDSASFSSATARQVSVSVAIAPSATAQHGTGAASVALSASSTGHAVKHGTGAASVALSASSTGRLVMHGRGGTAAVNAYPSPSCEAGGMAFAKATPVDSVTLGDTTWSAVGAGSAKVVIGSAPTTSTYVYQPVANADPVSNGHNRFAAAIGDTFDALWTAYADPANTAPVAVVPELFTYYWNGSSEVTTGATNPTGTPVVLNPGQSAQIVQRFTVPTPPVNPVDGVLMLSAFKAADGTSAPPTSAVIYLDRMMLVRNAPRPLVTEDYFDGDTAGNAWTGVGGSSSSTGVLNPLLTLSASSTGHVLIPTSHGTGTASLALTATSSGHAKMHGSGTASLALSATSAGHAKMHGSGAATLVLAASSSGRIFVQPRNIAFTAGEPTSSWRVQVPTGNPTRATVDPSRWQIQEPSL